MANEWGPLAGLAGEWEGHGGVDTAFSHSRGAVVVTPYVEKCTLTRFGPVDNGTQTLYGLDYRAAMWNADEVDPFHTEVGYWLWDGATGEVVKGFVIPRGVTTLAGGTAAADATTFTLRASLGDPRYGIGENRYLAENASTLRHEVTISVRPTTFRYEQTTMLAMNEFDEPFAHTDHHELHRVG